MNLKPTKFLRISVIAGTLLLAGCASSSQFGNSNRNLSTPSQLSPVAGGSVQSEALPPLQGEDANLNQSGIFDPNAPNNGGNMDFNSGDPMLANNNFEGQVAGVNSSFVNIDDVNSSNITPGGRDISGSLNVAKLLGTWNVSANQKLCRLNLTQTTKSGTNRYRASTPNCDIPVLSLVSSWQLTGTQVQLFDASGAIVGAFQRSGNRFVGTLAGGIAASMDG